MISRATSRQCGPLDVQVNQRAAEPQTVDVRREPATGSDACRLDGGRRRFIGRWMARDGLILTSITVRTGARAIYCAMRTTCVIRKWLLR
jgi:hypothetical protein